MQGVFCGKTVIQNVLFEQVLGFAKKILCNFDPYAYHYVLLSIVKSTAFAELIQNERMNVKIPTTKDEFKSLLLFTRVPASLS